MLNDLSNEMADAIEAAAPSVVQVQGRRRPASGLVYSDSVVVTMMRAVGREDGIQVRRHDGRTLEAELAGWDPATSLAVLRVPGLDAPAWSPAVTAVRVGHLALALGRSWSNGVTASAGIVAIVGGPLPTGRRRSIHEVIRTTAPMHDGFVGGALLDAAAGLTGIVTPMEIRGLRVVIPAPIVWQTAAAVLEHGGLKRSYLGIAGQPVRLPAPQARDAGQEKALLVIDVTAESPAAGAGVLVGDVIVAFEGRPIESPEELLDVLTGDRIGQAVTLTLLRGGAPRDVTLTPGERPSR